MPIDRMPRAAHAHQPHAVEPIPDPRTGSDFDQPAECVCKYAQRLDHRSETKAARCPPQNAVSWAQGQTTASKPLRSLPRFTTIPVLPSSASGGGGREPIDRRGPRREPARSAPVSRLQLREESVPLRRVRLFLGSLPSTVHRERECLTLEELRLLQGHTAFHCHLIRYSTR